MLNEFFKAIRVIQGEINKKVDVLSKLGEDVLHRDELRNNLASALTEICNSCTTKDFCNKCKYYKMKEELDV